MKLKIVPHGSEEITAVKPVEMDILIQRNHECFQKLGLKEKTVEYFSLGFCRSGVLDKRVVIPLHDETNHLVGYAGKSINENSFPEYILPAKFKNGNILYNLNRVLYNMEKERKIYVVKHCFDVFWLWQELGLVSVVAVLGNFLSERQITFLCNYSSSLFFISQGDKRNKNIFNRMALTMMTHKPVSIAYLPENIPIQKITKNDLSKIIM